jgi:acetyl esterase/lipase
MAAVVALMAKEQKTPALRFQLLMWPVTNAQFDTARTSNLPRATS